MMEILFVVVLLDGLVLIKFRVKVLMKMVQNGK